MKTPIRFIALAAALPLAVIAQSSSSDSSTSSGSSTGASGSSSSTGSYPSSSSSTSSPNSSSTRSSSSLSSPDSSSSLSSRSSDMNSGSSMSSAGTAGIERLSQREVDSQLTAKALIGKNVYDNGGKRIGEVKDIVLDSSSAPQLAGVTSKHSNDNAGSSDSMSSATSGSPRSTSSGATTSSGGGYASTSGPSTDTSSTRSSSMNSDTSSASMGSQGLASTGIASPAAIISSGGFLGMGDNLLRVPLTELSYDSGSDHITLNVSQDQISSLTNDRSSTRSAAE